MEIMTDKTYCTLLPDRECKKEDCCMELVTADKLKIKITEIVDKNNWSISCEK